MSTRILYISGNIGLGHVTRDLAIANALRSRKPDIDIVWIASEPALTVLRRAGERLHPATEDYRSDTAIANRIAEHGSLSILHYLFATSGVWLSHATTLRRVLPSESFDIILGDETYDLAVARAAHLLGVPMPFVMMYDFLGVDPMTSRWSERLGVYFWNLMWSATDGILFRKPHNRAVFIGEPDDIVAATFGPLLPDRRRHARRYYEFVGYVLPFDTSSLQDRQQVRAELGYSSGPLVVCAVGGLSVGRDLLELCGQAYLQLQNSVPGLQMMLVCGPSITPESLDVPDGVDVRGYVPQLYKHLAASDLAVVQAGGTTTLELTALQRPFIYFPVEGQCEQEITIADRLVRHGAGLKMSRATATPTDLAQAILQNLGTQPHYRPLPLNGADRISEIVLGLL